MANEYLPHRLCMFLPEMSDVEFVALRDDISVKGLLEPITLYEGMILDGRHRYRACVETGIEPRFHEYAGTDPAGYVISHNVTRRNLNASQRAMVAASFMEYETMEAKKRQACGQGGVLLVEPVPQAKARDKAGERLGVSGRYVGDAVKVIETGTPALVEEVRKGAIPITQAKGIAMLNPAAQARVIAAKTPEERHHEIMLAQSRRDGSIKRDAPVKPAVVHPGTPFLRKWLSAMERIAITLAEEGIHESDAIVQKFDEDMDWNSVALVEQFKRCVVAIEAMHRIHSRHGVRFKKD